MSNTVLIIVYLAVISTPIVLYLAFKSWENGKIDRWLSQRVRGIDVKKIEQDRFSQALRDILARRESGR